MQHLTRTKWCTRTLLKKTNIDQFDCLRNFNRWQLADMRKFYFKKIERHLQRPAEIQILTCLELDFSQLCSQGQLINQ